MLLNLTNPPFRSLGGSATASVAQYGECVDMPFPAVDPDGDERIYRPANR